MKQKKNTKKDKIFYIRLFLLVTLGLAIFDNYKNATKVIMNLTQSWGGWSYNPGWWNGEEEVLETCRYLIKQEKFTKEAASGIIGNFKYESDMNPYKREAVGDHDKYSDTELANRLDPDNDTFGPGRGLAQWGDGSGENGLGSNRWSKLIKYVNRKYDKKYESKPSSSWNNKNNSSKDVVMAEWPTLQEQLSFVKYELVNGVSSRRGTLNFSKLNSYGVKDATYWFAAIYENPAEKKFQKTLNDREKEAQRVYKMYCSKI